YDSNYKNTSLTIEPKKPYEHDYGFGSTEHLVYTANFIRITYTEYTDTGPPALYTYNADPQGHQAQMTTGLSDTYKHKYYNSSGAEIGATKPTNAGSYSYDVVIERNEKNTIVNGELTSSVSEVVVGYATKTQFTIQQYTPSGSTQTLGITIDSYVFGDTVSNDLIKRTSLPTLKGDIDGTYTFVDTSILGTKLSATKNELQIKFTPSTSFSSNIKGFTLGGYVSIVFTKAALLVGYINDNGVFTTDLNGLKLPTLIYGQGYASLGVPGRLVFKHSTYPNDYSVANSAFTITASGIESRPAVTSTGSFNIGISINSNATFKFNGDDLKYTTAYNLQTPNHTLSYTVIQEVLQFPTSNYNGTNYSLQFSVNSNTTIGTASITYGQALTSITVAVIANIGSVIGKGSQTALDQGTMQYTWGRMDSSGKFEPLTDYISGSNIKYLTVKEGTNIQNTGNENYYCIQAVLLDGQGINANYEPYYFKNQVLTIKAAKINNDKIFAASIKYGESVEGALPKDIQSGQAINQINHDLIVYYKIEWNIDDAAGIQSVSTYPYHVVTTGKRYAVKIVIYKDDTNQDDANRDRENYENEGVFTLGHNNTNLQLNLVVERSTQDFYVMVNGNLVPITSADLTAALTALNPNVNEETSKNILDGEDIDVETVYNSQERTFTIELYTTAVIFNGKDKQGIDQYNKLDKATSSLTFTTYRPLGGTAVLTTGNISSELYNHTATGTYYTKFTYIVNISSTAADNASILNLKIGQYDSGIVLNNPTGGNYLSKEWTRDSENVTDTPYTIFIKLRSAAAGISDATYLNPEDNSDSQKYSYVTEYGGQEVVITPKTENNGILSFDAEASSGDVKIITVEGTEIQTFKLETLMPGAVKFIYQADGYVNQYDVLDKPYIAIYHEFWVYISKKSVTLTVVIDETSITYGKSPSIKVGTPAEGTFIGNDFTTVEKDIKFYIYGLNEEFNKDKIYPVVSYSVGISNWDEIGEDTSNNARFYTVLVSTEDFTVKKKNVDVNFAEGTFEIDYCSTDVTKLTYKLSYDGILEQDAIDTSNNRVIILDPTTGYEIVTKYAPVGTYNFDLLVWEDPANYTYTLQEKSLTIKPVEVIITHESSTNVAYTANIFNFSNKATVTGVTNGTAPLGTVTIKYVLTNGEGGTDGEEISAIRDAGTYSVIVSYKPIINDNYKATEVIFQKCITVETVAPTIQFPELVQKYSGASITYSPSVVGLGTDTTLAGTVTVEFAPQNTEVYSVAMPKNVGIYSVRVKYTPNASDNYHEVTDNAYSIIEITKADIVLTPESISMEVTYNAQYVTKPEITAWGVGNDTSQFSAGHIYVYYSLTTTSSDWNLWNVEGDEKKAPINAGSYDLKIVYLADKGSNSNAILKNYADTTIYFRNGAIKIKQAQLESLYLKGDAITESYTALQHSITVSDQTIGFSTGITNPVQEDAINLANVSIEYATYTSTLDGIAYGTFTSIAPTNVGTYTVKLVYTSNGITNFTTSSFIIEEAVITITAVEPSITLNSTRLPYNGNRQPATRYNISGIKTDKPTGSIIISYRPHNTSEWTTDAPITIGKYDVKITFTANLNGNYTSKEVVVTGGFEIVNGNLDVTLQKRLSEDYTGAPVDPANPKVIDPEGHPITSEYITIQYRPTGDGEWEDDPPSESGYYDIRIAVEASDIYVEYDNIFTQYLRIKNVNPSFTLTSQISSYNGNSQAFPLEHALLTNSKSIAAEDANLANDSLSDELKGSVEFYYSTDGNIWTNTLPLNVGIYAIRIDYMEAVEDNFSSSQSKIFNAAYTIRPHVITVIPTTGSKIYDGKIISGSDIQYTYDVGHAPFGDDTAINSSALSAGTNTVVGRYAITLGNLEFGSNYAVQLENTTTYYYSITTKPITVKFHDLDNPIYDGQPKVPNISIIEDLALGDDISQVNLVRQITGSTVSVGTFTIALSIPSSSNYAFATEAIVIHTYTITNAQMTNNKFASDIVEVLYDSHEHELKLISEELGSTVSYIYEYVLGGQTLQVAATSYTEVGEYKIIANVTKTNYEPDTKTAILKIVKGRQTFAVSPPERTLYYGESLPKLTVFPSTGTASLNAGQELTPGTNTYTWTYVPYDTERYQSFEGQINLTVEKASVAESSATLKINGNLSQVAGSAEEITVKLFLPGQDDPYMITPKIYYKDSSGVTYNSMPTSPGKYIMYIEIDGDEYVSTETITKMFILEQPPVYWPYIAGGVVLLLLILI
ncbi:MAG: hypothetical protein LBE09_03315, partial [Christensenellaceae bacterium]|nr:hypothetical protein [Christensenellaceae bacterium]